MPFIRHLITFIIQCLLGDIGATLDPYHMSQLYTSSQQSGDAVSLQLTLLVQKVQYQGMDSTRKDKDEVVMEGFGINSPKVFP